MSEFARSSGSYVVLVTVWLAASSAQADPRQPTHVACVGDSITQGTGASSTSKNYPSLLQGLLGNSVQVKNFGKSGATMLSSPYGDKPYDKQAEYTSATDFVSKAGAGAVVSVVIVLGANDSKPFNWDPAAGKNDQQYLKDYRALVDHFAGLATKPTIYVAYPLATGTNPCCEIRGNVIHDEQIPLIKQVAMEKHLPIIDLNTGTTGHPEYFDDGVHPNDAGYVVMANLVKKGLEREPTVSVTSPTMGQTFNLGTVPLTADASADYVDITSVEFFAGTMSLGKATAKPFKVDWAPVPGPYQITAKAIDATLATATSAPITCNVGESMGGSGGAGPSAGAGGGGGASGGATGGGTTGGSGGATGGAAPGAAGTTSAGAAGTVGVAGTGGAAGSPVTPNPTTPTESDAGCSCSTPGSRSGGLGVGLMAAALVSLLRRRQRIG